MILQILRLVAKSTLMENLQAMASPANAPAERGGVFSVDWGQLIRKRTMPTVVVVSKFKTYADSLQPELRRRTQPAWRSLPGRGLVQHQIGGFL